ncbi:MAG: MoxR family ATPase [Myxococcota bacterium]
MSETAMNLESGDDRSRVNALHEKRNAIQEQIGRRIVGQRDVIDHLLITLFARGHALFVGVPGLAKTTLIQTLADVLDLSFNRIQFTPDLMPSDITGTDIIDTDSTGNREFRFVQGPVFCNLLLADEINRTPPKTQAALLQSMQEKQVTASGRTYPLQPPFHVFATQNPIEQEGTYPLPEAQLDRFMMMLRVEYPTAEEEAQIIKQTTTTTSATVEKVLTPQDILDFQELVLRVPVSDPVVETAVRLVRMTRPSEGDAPSVVKDYVTYGAGPRAGQHIILASKARAILEGRPAVDIADLKSLAHPVLRHRILTNFQAEARKISVDEVIETIIGKVL